MKTIRVQCTPVKGRFSKRDLLPFVDGRNGTWPITAIEIVSSSHTAGICGIGKRNRAIRGGFICIPFEDMDALCEAWLEARLDDRFDAWFQRVDEAFQGLQGKALEECMPTVDLTQCFAHGEAPEHVARKLVYRLGVDSGAPPPHSPLWQRVDDEG